MKIKFDSHQQFQLDAVDAVVRIFEGLPTSEGQKRSNLTLKGEGLFQNTEQNELGFGNHLSLSEEELLKNVQAIQKRNDIKVTPTLLGKDFSIEMETGTGKTYVYLRSIFELKKQYGFTKFVIVVPSVAIREGVLKNLQITQEHFRGLYDNVPFNYAVYDSQKMSIVKNFAGSNQLQILVINIDAFRKDFTDTEEENKGVLFHRASEKLNGRSPREYVQSVHPIVIIDEPQSVDNTAKAKMAIATLNPLCCLRYSATHINPYNLMYKLDPIKAYALRLVKQISVASARSAGNTNDAFVQLLDVDNKKGIKAKLKILAQTENGPREKSVTVKSGTDLYELSGHYERYKEGFQVSEINCEPGNEYVLFSRSGIKLNKGATNGGVNEDVKKAQIKNTIEEHLKKIIQVKDRGIKVLSLFFIDRVANYRVYEEDGSVAGGKYVKWFEEEFNKLVSREEYKGLIPHTADAVHDGYFAEDNHGNLKDTNGATKADESTYDKIMKNKEQLLSLEEPLQFIFSHSALREGWDNPNVFQICTLNETNAVMKKRQEIGRGLRLPVDQTGERVFDDSINKLVVIANESYEEFAEKLQTEYRDDCGVLFGVVPIDAFARIHRVIKDEDVEVGLEDSERIWMSAKSNGYLNDDGLLTPVFDPDSDSFHFKIDKEFDDISGEVLDIMASYLITKHVRPKREPRNVKLNKQVYADPEFEELWKRISKKTTYSVNYDTEELIKLVAKKIGEMTKIEPIKIQFVKAELDIDARGVGTRETKNQITEIENDFPLPDVLSYLQMRTDLMRKTLYRILKESGRLKEFEVNPQKFMDQVAGVVKNELHGLIVSGIKYEKIAGEEYRMERLKEGELASYLEGLLISQKSVYNYVEYDSEVEKKFAQELEKKEQIKLFIKLPRWFVVDTPIGTYNPDWAIVKHGDETVYLVRETKGTADFEKLRNSEAYKIKCGEKHFAEIGVDFKTVTNAREL